MKLKTCPFCGGKAEIIESQVPLDIKDEDTYYILCEDCLFQTTELKDEHDLIMGWNCRVKK